MAVCNLPKGNVVILDPEDVHLTQEYKYHKIKKTGIIQRAIYSHRKKKTVGHVGIAQDVLKVKSSTIVLFVNDNKSDCRKKNLLIANKKNRNFRAKVSSSNTSGYKGVSYNKKSGKYEANIRKNYKKHFLGAYNNPVDAAAAYNRAAIKHFGEKYARLNIV